jgi:hypothetical protein
MRTNIEAFPVLLRHANLIDQVTFIAQYHLLALILISILLDLLYPLFQIIITTSVG